MNANQIIQRIHEEAKRPEVHVQPADYRRAVARERRWRQLSNDARRKALEFSEGNFDLLDLALEEARP